MNKSPDWGELPALAVANIYKHLDWKDMLIASTACWHWRTVLFQKRFFQNFKFKLNIEDDRQCNFFMQNLLNLTSELTISFDIINAFHIEKLRRILYKTARNNIIGLRLQTKSIGLATPGDTFPEDELYNIEQIFVEPIKLLLARKNPSFKILDLGAIECLTYYASDFLKLIAKPQDLKEFIISSIKFDPSHYPILAIEHILFEKCVSLQVLSLDYDTLNNDVLRTIQILPLKKLMICVHGLDRNHAGISDTAWENFANKFEHIDLIITLIYAYEAVEVLQHAILRRCMPITHLRVLFCNYMNLEALDLMSQHYNDTLKSVQWIDSAIQESERNVMDLYLRSGQDPFVMMSWRCKMLQEIVIHGYVVDPHNLVGISRLRGKMLQSLEVSMLDSATASSMMGSFIEEISTQLGRKWEPLDVSNIHPALGYIPVSDDVRDEYILAVMRSDLSN